MPERYLLDIRRTFKATPDEVFEAFRNPSLLRDWAAPDEHRNESVEQDFRVGGAYRRTMRFPDGSLHVLSGVFRRIDPPSRLAYTYRWETLPIPETLVEIQLTEGPHGTEVHLVHSGFPDPHLTDDHETGWRQCLVRLENLLES